MFSPPLFWTKSPSFHALCKMRPIFNCPFPFEHIWIHHSDTRCILALCWKYYPLTNCKHEGHEWGIVAWGHGSIDRVQRGPYKNDWGPIFPSMAGLEQARLVSSLLYGTWKGNGLHDKIPTRKEPIRMLGFTLRLPRHIINYSKYISSIMTKIRS